MAAAIRALADPDDPSTWPGVNALRDHLDKGSWNTIQKHLVALRKEAVEARDALPDELLEPLRVAGAELWKHALQAAAKQERELRKRVTELEDRHQATRLAADEQLAEAGAEIDRLNGVLEDLRREHEGEVANWRSRLNEAEVALQAAAAKDAEAQLVIEDIRDARQRDRAAADAAATAQERTLAARDSEIQRLTTAAEHLTSARDQALARGDELEQANEALRSELKALQEREQGAKKQALALERQIAKLVADKDALTATLEESRRSGEILERANQQADRHNAQLSTQIEHLNQRIRILETPPEGETTNGT